RTHRWLLARRCVLARYSAAGRAGTCHHGAVQLHGGVERIHCRRAGDAGRRNVYTAARTQELSVQLVDTMGSVRGGLDLGEPTRRDRVFNVEPIFGVRIDTGISEGIRLTTLSLSPWQVKDLDRLDFVSRFESENARIEVQLCLMRAND